VYIQSQEDNEEQLMETVPTQLNDFFMARGAEAQGLPRSPCGHSEIFLITFLDLGEKHWRQA